MSEFIKVAHTSDVPVGGRLQIELDYEDVLLFNLDGNFYAIADLCTHDDGPLGEGEMDGPCIVCPRHGARFNVMTGEQTMPAFSPVPRYELKIENNEIWLLPLED